MFKFTKKLVLAVSFLGIYSSQFEAFGSKPILDEAGNSKQQLVLLDAAAFVPQRQVFDVKEKHGGFQDGLPKDLVKAFLVEAFKRGADPRYVERVCKAWYNMVRYKIPGSGAPKADLAGIAYETKLNDIFMEDCMKLYIEGVVSRAVLYYKKGEPGREQEIRFSDSEDGTANLANCGNESYCQVYTISEDRARMVGGANENRLVTYIAPFLKARHLLPAGAAGLGRISDVVVIWRWGNTPIMPDMIDYLIINPALLDHVNMYVNWKKGACGARCGVMSYSNLRAGAGFFRLACEPKSKS